MRRLVTTVTVIGVIAAIGALAAPTALAAPRLLQVSPKQVNFGNLAGSNCIALAGQVLAPGESCVAVVGFQPSEFFAGHWQTATLLVTARDPVSGALLQSVTVKVRGKGSRASGERLGLVPTGWTASTCTRRCGCGSPTT